MELTSKLDAAMIHPGAAGGADPAASFALATSRAEAVAQLTQRLATIQLLRDGLYRACEAYANGAISDTAYALMLSRYGDVMVTMLLGELAAGKTGTQVIVSSPVLSPAKTGALGAQEPAPKTNGGAGASGAGGGGGAHPGDTGDGASGGGGGGDGSDSPTDAANSDPAPNANDPDSASAAGTATQANAPPAAEVSQQLEKMQANFLNKTQFAPLLVACVSALDRHGCVLDWDTFDPKQDLSPQCKNSGGVTPFAALCYYAIQEIAPKLPSFLEKRMESSPPEGVSHQ